MNEKLEVIISHYGELHQIKKAIEELDELKEALRDNHAVEHITEEIADVFVMLCQLMTIYDIDADLIDDIMKHKIDRTIDRMQVERNE